MKPQSTKGCKWLEFTFNSIDKELKIKKKWYFMNYEYIEKEK